MKKHVTLPGLQIAGAAFLAAQGAEAGKVFCANAEKKVVAGASCNGNAPAGTFFMFSSESQHPVGTSVSSKIVPLYDSATFFEQRHALFPADIPLTEFEFGGFGKRQACNGKGGNGS
ncbi:hypothetical protein CCHL11_08115 [Colletotrichum chlorophyti]|uniref:Uncharacterized protein n=1 Tax=Colletotrichum chlorophyti TaxID=708187 RepID=A0A1Q8S1G7_9PEZI|nr:hypothetical protein CCHL11_08115 [Colletotrichum chlorophyti]